MEASNSILVSFSIGLLLCVALPTKAFSNTIKDEAKIKRSDFPKDFFFGVGTSAMQTEGSADKFGKGPSIWDYDLHKHPGRIADNGNISVAVDHYRRYKSDVQLIKKLGVEHYRFSIAWTRILPYGSLSGGINQQGIDHYNNLIDELLANGIQPFVTLLHADPPYALDEKYGGPLNRSFIQDFKDYSEICFKAFGDRVKHWITVNEPSIIASLGYCIGYTVPRRCSMGPLKCDGGNSSTEPYIVGHNLLLAHAAAVKVYKDKYQKTQRGEIGIDLVGEYAEPYDPDSPDDRAATKRAADFMLGWFVEPLVFGEYPESMVKLVKDRLPSFTEEEKKMVKGAYDYIGINYYSASYFKNREYNPNDPPIYFYDMLAQQLDERDGVPIGPKAGGTSLYNIYPEGLEKLLHFMKLKYNSPPIYILENGISEENRDDMKLEQSLNDTHRITYIQAHLRRISNAINDGANVKGYFYWALFDDFEFEDGFIPRFGFYYIDFKNNLKRIPKLSASWYKSFLKHHNEM